MTVMCQTERLILRCFVREDVDALHTVLGNAEAMRFSLKGPLNRDGVVRWLEPRLLATGRNEPCQYAVLSQQDGSFLGFSGVTPFSDPDGDVTYEIGYRFHPSCWGVGIGTEAARATLALVFDRFQLPSVAAVVEEANVASVRILNKIGMTYVKNTLYHGIPVMKYLIRREAYGPAA